LIPDAGTGPREETTMHHWYEMYVVGRERTADRLRHAEALHRSDEVRAERARPRGGHRDRLVTLLAGPLRRGGGAPGVRATLVLAANEVISVRGRARPCRVTCVAGRLWVTVDGSREDYALEAGEEVTVRARGKVVVQALRTSTVRLESPRLARVAVDSPLTPRLLPG
jgi:hypothetical protein